MKQLFFLIYLINYVHVGLAQNLSFDNLEGTYQLVYTHLNGEIRAVEENQCGFSEILEIQAPRKLKPQDTWSQSVLFRGETDVWGCGVNPVTYKIELYSSACNTATYQTKEDPTIWFLRGESGSYKMKLELLDDYLFFSLIEIMDDEAFIDPLFGKNETIVYQKIANEPFRNLLEQDQNK